MKILSLPFDEVERRRSVISELLLYNETITNIAFEMKTSRANIRYFMKKYMSPSAANTKDAEEWARKYTFYFNENPNIEYVSKKLNLSHERLIQNRHIYEHILNIKLPRFRKKYINSSVEESTEWIIKYNDLVRSGHSLSQICNALGFKSVNNILYARKYHRKISNLDYLKKGQ